MDEFLPDPKEVARASAGPDLEVVAPIAFVIGFIVTLVCALALPKALDIGFERGAHGTYVVADVPTCGSACRSRGGLFTSDDGKITRTGVALAGYAPRPLKQGDSVRAFDVGDTTDVYLTGYGEHPRAVLPWFFGVAGVLAMAFGLGHVVRESWRKRR